MPEHWRLVIDYDRRGYPMGQRLVCPTCWPTNTEPVGRTPFGSTAVALVSKTLSVDEACYHCDRHPEAQAVSA